MAYSSSSNNYAPSAPSLPESEAYTYAPGSQQGQYEQQPPYSVTTIPPVSQQGRYEQQRPYPVSTVPPGAHPDPNRIFASVDRDRSGFIDEGELQQALSFAGYQMFNLRTMRLLMFLFKSPYDPQLRLGSWEFGALWSCLGQWRVIFEKYDRDKSGKIDLFELKDALYSLGYALPSSVLRLLISRYDDGTGKSVEFGFDSFVECGMIVKGLTEKFMEKDRRRTGSATFTYDSFLSMVIPFLVSYD